LCVQEDHGKALTGGAGGSVAAFRPKRCRGGEARVHSTRLPRTNTTTAPPPPSHQHQATRRAGRGEEKQAPPIPFFLPRRDRLRPAQMVSATVSSSHLSSLPFSSADCRCCLCTVPLQSAHQPTRSRSLSSRGVREELARFDLRCSCSFTSYSSATLSVLSSRSGRMSQPAFSLGSILIDRVDEQSKQSEHSCSLSVQRRIRTLI
jgi:hypothetical protein